MGNSKAIKQQGSGLLEPQRGKMADEEKGKAEATEQKNEEVKALDKEPGKTIPEKTLTQTEVNKLMADERRKAEATFKTLKSEYDDFKKGIEEREKTANDAAVEKVEALRKDLPEAITKLLDKLTPVEQLDWLNDPENVITKKEIPPLPEGVTARGGQRKSISIV